MDTDDLPAFSFRPIGFFRGAAARKYDAPRQGAFAESGDGAVELLPGRNFETGRARLAAPQVEKRLDKTPWMNHN